MINSNFLYNNSNQNKTIDSFFYYKLSKGKNLGNINKRINSYNNGKSENISLVVINDNMYQSTIGLYISGQARIYINPSYSSHIFSQIIGHLLGDGNLTFT
jgi:hypothetical protein